MKILTEASMSHFLPAYMVHVPCLIDLQFVHASKMREAHSEYDTSVMQIPPHASKELVAVMIAMLPTKIPDVFINDKSHVNATLILTPDDKLVTWRNTIASCTTLEDGRDYAIIGDRNIDTWPLVRCPMFYVMSYSMYERLMRGISFNRVIIDKGEHAARTLSSLPISGFTHVIVEDFRKLAGRNIIGDKFRQFETMYHATFFDPLVQSLMIAS